MVEMVLVLVVVVVVVHAVHIVAGSLSSSSLALPVVLSLSSPTLVPLYFHSAPPIILFTSTLRLRMAP